MTPAPPDIEIVIRGGAVERRVPLVAIAAVLHVSPSTIRMALGRLLFDVPRAMEGEPTEGVDRFVSIRERNEVYVQRFVSTRGGGAGEERPAALSSTATLSAEELADALDDWPNLGHLRQVVERETPVVVREALRRTLAIPHERVRTRRGAYFIGVLRALTKTSSPSRPHA